MAIDYFSRWIEAESFGTLKVKQMAKFVEKSLICRYGVPHHIVTDNGVQFQAEITELLQRYGIKHHKSSPYQPQANGAVEVANKNVVCPVAVRVVGLYPYKAKGRYFNQSL